MILILVAIILVLFITIVHLCFDFYKQKKAFENRIDVLEDIIYGIGKTNKEVKETTQNQSQNQKLIFPQTRNTGLLSRVKSREE